MPPLGPIQEGDEPTVLTQIPEEPPAHRRKLNDGQPAEDEHPYEPTTPAHSPRNEVDESMEPQEQPSSVAVEPSEVPEAAASTADAPPAEAAEPSAPSLPPHEVPVPNDDEDLLVSGKRWNRFLRYPWMCLQQMCVTIPISYGEYLMSVSWQPLQQPNNAG